jgi:hypothetical protein
VILYPFSTVKVRVQQNQYKIIDYDMKPQYLTERKYKNVADVMLKMIKNEGPKSFYKGFIVNICRQVPQ